MLRVEKSDEPINIPTRARNKMFRNMLEPDRYSGPNGKAAKSPQKVQVFIAESHPGSTADPIRRA